MNKQELQVNTPADYYIQKSLKDYPKEQLLQHFDEDVVLIDEKLYKALKHKAVPLFIERNYSEENRRDLQYIKEALELIKEKCKKENITTMEELDNKVLIHYVYIDILDRYLDILTNRRNPSNEDIDY